MWHLTQPLVHASPTLELLVGNGSPVCKMTSATSSSCSQSRELGLDLLEKIAGASVLEALERRGLLMVAKSAQRVEVSLSHPLFAEVINLQLPAVRGRRIRRTLADALSADGARRRGDRVRVVAWSLEGGGHVDVCLLAEAARLALVEGDEAMAERILAQAPEGDRTPEIVQLVASCASAETRRTRSRSCWPRSTRRARRRGPPGRAPAGDEPVLRPGRLLARSTCSCARSTTSPSRSTVKGRGLRGPAAGDGRRGRRRDRPLGLHGADVERGGPARPVAGTLPRACGRGTGGKRASSPRLASSTSRCRRTCAVRGCRSSCSPRCSRSASSGAWTRRATPRRSTAATASLRCATGCCSRRRGSTCRWDARATNVRR